MTLVSRETFQGVGTLNAAAPGNLGTVTGSFYKRPAGPAVAGVALSASGEVGARTSKDRPRTTCSPRSRAAKPPVSPGRMICGWYFFSSVTDDGVAGRALGLLASMQTVSGATNISFSIDKTCTLSVLNGAGGTRTDAVPAPVLIPGQWYWLALAWLPNADNGYGNGDFRAYYRTTRGGGSRC